MSIAKMNVTPNTCVNLDTEDKFVPCNYAFYKIGDSNIPLKKNSDGTFRIPRDVYEIYYEQFDNIDTFKTFGSYYTRTVKNKCYLLNEPTLHFSTWVPDRGTTSIYGGLLIIGDYTSAKSNWDWTSDSGILTQLINKYDELNKEYVRFNYGDSETSKISYQGKSDVNSNYGLVSSFSSDFDALSGGRYRIKLQITPDAQISPDDYFGVRVLVPNLGKGYECRQRVLKWEDLSGQQEVYIDVDDFIASDNRTNTDYQIQVITRGQINPNGDIFSAYIEGENRLDFTLTCYELGNTTGSIIIKKLMTDKYVWKNRDTIQYDLAIYGLKEGTQYCVAGFCKTSDTYTWSDTVINDYIRWSDVILTDVQDSVEYTEFI